MGHTVAADPIVVVRGHHGVPTTEGHPQGARAGRRTVSPGGQDGGAASSVLVAPSLLLTTREVAATVQEARKRAAIVGMPVRAAGVRLALDPDHAFVTSPALGWTLVGVADRGLPTLRVSRLAGLVLPTVDDGVRIGGMARWVEGARILADLDLRLRVMGGRGDWLRRALGM